MSGYPPIIGLTLEEGEIQSSIRLFHFLSRITEVRDSRNINPSWFANLTWSCGPLNSFKWSKPQTVYEKFTKVYYG